jgi:serine/threonine protein kinase
MSRDIKLENTLLVLQPDKKPLLKVRGRALGGRAVGGGGGRRAQLRFQRTPRRPVPLADAAATAALAPIQLCDFGYSKHVDLDSVAKSKVGTPGYTAPGAAGEAGGRPGRCEGC